jgi:hypothetical protein
MNDDPKSCSVMVNGKPCTNRPVMYKVGQRGFCEQHKPVLGHKPPMLELGRHEGRPHSFWKEHW